MYGFLNLLKNIIDKKRINRNLVINFLKQIFTWWHRQTLGTFIYTFFVGKFVGFDEFGNKIKLILDGGKTKIGLESTIVDLTDKVSILRPGGITIERLEKVLHRKLKLKRLIKNIKSPGQLGFHYSPGIPVRLNAKYPKKNEAFLQFSGKAKNKNNYFTLSKSGNMREAAKNLFSILRLIKK